MWLFGCGVLFGLVACVSIAFSVWFYAVLISACWLWFARWCGVLGCCVCGFDVALVFVVGWIVLLFGCGSCVGVRLLVTQVWVCLVLWCLIVVLGLFVIGFGYLLIVGLWGLCWLWLDLLVVV